MPPRCQVFNCQEAAHQYIGRVYLCDAHAESYMSVPHVGLPEESVQGFLAFMKLSTPTPDSQIKQLADFIMHNIPGEPSQSESAVETAIRLLKRTLPAIASPCDCGAKPEEPHTHGIGQPGTPDLGQAIG